MADRWDGIDRRRTDRRTHTGSLDLAGAVDGIADRAAQRALADAAARVRAWGSGLTSEQQRWVAMAAADVVEEGR